MGWNWKVGRGEREEEGGEGVNSRIGAAYAWLHCDDAPRVALDAMGRERGGWRRRTHKRREGHSPMGRGAQGQGEGGKERRVTREVSVITGFVHDVAGSR